MRFFIFSMALAACAVMTSASKACNGMVGGQGTTSTGGATAAALRAASALRSGSMGTTSPMSQQVALQQLANERVLQLRYQQILAAEEQLADQGNQPTATTRAEQLSQARADKIAKRKAREAELQAKRDELKAKNLAKRAATEATTQVASGQ